MDDFQWIRDIKPCVILQPDTQYYFDPKLNKSEMSEMGSRLSHDQTEIKDWFDFIYERYNSISYMYIRSHEEDLEPGQVYLGGWCTNTYYKDSFHNKSCESINGRELFYL